MAATSDVVVLGTVVDVRDGTKIGPPGEEIEHLDAAIKVSEALYGSIGADSLTVQTLKFVAPEVDWRKSGGTVLAFLKLSADPVDGGRFYPVNDQSVFLVTDADVRATILEDPFSERVAAMTLEEIRRELADAAEAISAGEVAPQSPAGG